MKENDAIRCLYSLRDLVLEFLRRTDDLAELVDERFAMIENRLAAIDKLKGADGCRHAALVTVAGRRRSERRPTLSMILKERNGKSSLKFADGA